MEKIKNILELSGWFIGIVLVTIVLAYIVRRLFTILIRKSTAELKNDPTNYIFLKHSLSALIYLVGFGVAIYMMPNLRALANSMLAGAGILAVAVGFASQHALSNIISGIFIVIFKPFRVADRVKLRELTGIVEDITLRHTVIRDFENKRIVIPNSLISNEIIINSNFGDEKTCKWIRVHISYESNLSLAKNLIKETILAHPLHIDNRTEEQIKAKEEIAPVRVMSMGENGILLQGWAWALNSADGFVMECDILENLFYAFKEAGVEIPYPQRVVIEKKAKG